MSARAALARAHADAAHPVAAPADGVRRARTLAIGDPQAPLETFFAILEAHGALGDDGRLLPDTALVSMGDHFDWGSRAEREEAAADGTALLAWLAAHPADQVTILTGNHDLARVGELDHVDDEAFARMQARADGIAKDDVEENRRFAADTGFFSAELVNRDFSTFRAAQRALVEELLRAGRLQLAHARGDLLFVHAGVTLRELDALGSDVRTPAAVAAALNRALALAVEDRERRRRPLAIPGVHAPGDGEREGSGALYHRPAHGISDEERRDGRRFDPRTLPRGIVQLVGHVRDQKCRTLLGPWADDRPAQTGVLRHLVAHEGAVDQGVRYRHGVPEAVDPRAATMIFLDGGMNDVRGRPEAYELFDVEKRTVARRP